MKVKVNLSLDQEIADCLKLYAKQRHTTVSQAVTDWVLQQQVKKKEKSVRDDD